MRKLSCSGRKSVNINKSKITHFLEMLPYKNETSKFLILLNPEDFENSCLMIPSLKKRIIYFNDFPGELIIYNFSDISNFEYKIEDAPESKKLYIMLPKEEIFIDIQNFETRLLASKVDELINIFMYLGAKEIEIEQFYNNIKNKNISITTGVDINQIDIGVENTIGNNSNSLDEKKQLLTYPINDNLEINIIELLNYYYLPKQSEWKNIIINRIDGLILEYEYKYTNKLNKKITRKLINKLKKLNISISYDKEECVNIIIKFKVKFNDLLKGNIFYPDTKKND